MSACDDRSAAKNSTDGLPVSRRIESAPTRLRCRFRPTMTTAMPCASQFVRGDQSNAGGGASDETGFSGGGGHVGSAMWSQWIPVIRLQS